MTAMGGDTNQANKLNPWKFSDCSVAYFRDYIEELYVSLVSEFTFQPRCVVAIVFLNDDLQTTLNIKKYIKE